MLSGLNQLAYDLAYNRELVRKHTNGLNKSNPYKLSTRQLKEILKEYEELIDERVNH